MVNGVLNQPGSGWERLAFGVATAIPVQEVDAVWVFRTLRREGSEWGTALLSCITGENQERRQIYTARFMHVLKGKDRGKFEWVLEEVGSGPIETIGEIIAGVRKRMDDEEPRPVAPHTWLPAIPDGPPREG